jgi:hypothetical protein
MGAFLASRCAIARGKRPDFQFLPRGIGPCAGTMRHGGGEGKQYGTIVSTVSSNIVDDPGANAQYLTAVSAGYSSANSMDLRATRLAVADFIRGRRSRTLVTCQ